jgi:hypothetical protein
MTLHLNDFHKQIPAHLSTQYGDVPAKKFARQSPALSRRELKRLIADMLD